MAFAEASKIANGATPAGAIVAKAGDRREQRPLDIGAKLVARALSSTATLLVTFLKTAWPLP
jgi:hypothetical protein